MASSSSSLFEAARKTGVLHLSYLGLTSVPHEVFTIPNLVRLDLSNNEITHIPKDIGLLHQLEQLWLNNNPLVSLPDEIAGCKHLRSLDLRDTLLSSLPGTIGSLPEIIDISIGNNNTRLDSKIQSIVQRGGTLQLLSYLHEQQNRRELEIALRTTLTVEIYTEAADTVIGKQRIEELVKETLIEFTDNNELRTVIRNAARLFNAIPALASAAEARAKYTELQRDNARKALAADVELKLRSVYYDRMDVTKLEYYVKDIMNNMPTLEDAAFFLEHATNLLPKETKDIQGKVIHKDLLTLRAVLAEQRASALATLVTALTNIYPDRDPSDIDKLARSVAIHLKLVDDIRMLASDAPEIFPAEYGAIKVKNIIKSFQTAKEEKSV
jgi:hypothetical protein